MDKQASKHAKALSELGAAKGGKARAEALTAEERSEIARYAAKKRWGDKSGFPRATHSGDLQVGHVVIRCHVLDDENKRRLLSGRSVTNAMGLTGRGQGMTRFLESKSLKPFVNERLSLAISRPVAFIASTGGLPTFGYEAWVLPELCKAVLEAAEKRKITPGQKAMAEQARILLGAFATVGIIALVDEATGYQADRARDELSKILEAYIVEELRPWLKTFPDEFFKQIYRLHGWPYRVGSAKRPSYVGQIINKYVYEQLPPPVLPELRKLNPVTDRGYRRHKHFQYLTADTGNIHLDRQITAVTTILKVSDDRKDFEENFKKAFGKSYQPRLPLIVEVPPKDRADR
jgi:hypothetical protein